LATDNAIGKSTAYDYLHEGIDALAARAPKLESALLAAKMAGHPHVNIDGLITRRSQLLARVRLNEQEQAMNSEMLLLIASPIFALTVIVAANIWALKDPPETELQRSLSKSIEEMLNAENEAENECVNWIVTRCSTETTERDGYEVRPRPGRETNRIRPGTDLTVAPRLRYGRH
jgi:hypothetical protein